MGLRMQPRSEKVFTLISKAGPNVVEERYMEDPTVWGDEWPENPPIYEAADM
jgi:hypothetical protein